MITLGDNRSADDVPGQVFLFISDANQRFSILGELLKCGSIKDNAYLPFHPVFFDNLVVEFLTFSVLLHTESNTTRQLENHTRESENNSQRIFLEWLTND